MHKCGKVEAWGVHLWHNLQLATAPVAMEVACKRSLYKISPGKHLMAKVVLLVACKHLMAKVVLSNKHSCEQDQV